MSIAVAKTNSMPLDMHDQVYSELSREYPTIPSHVILGVMQQYACNKYECTEALKTQAPMYVDNFPPTNTQNVHGMYAQERARYDDTTSQGTAIRQRSDSAGSVSSNSSNNEIQLQRPAPAQTTARGHYTTEATHFVDQYSQGYMLQQFQPNDPVQYRHLRIVEETSEDVPPVVQVGSWTDSNQQHRGGQSSYHMNQHLASPPVHRHYDNQRSLQGQPHVSRPQRFDQVFPDRNGDFRDSPNSPSPVSHPGGYQGTPPTPPVNTLAPYHPVYGYHGYPGQNSAYPQQQLNHGHGYSPQPGSYPRHTSQSSNISHQNYKSSINIPFVSPESGPQAYRQPSPSQPHNDMFRNVPQSLPVYRQSFHQQASSDSSPGTPGHKRATTPGQYSPPLQGQASSPVVYSQAISNQSPTPGQYTQAMGGKAATPGQYAPVIAGQPVNHGHSTQMQYPQSQYPPGVPIPYGIPGPQLTSGQYAFAGAQHQTLQYVFSPANEQRAAWSYQEGDGSNQHNVPFRRNNQSPTDVQTPMRQQSNQSNNSQRSSAGDDSEYITTLLEHQHKRKLKLEEDLESSYRFVERLKLEVTTMESDLMSRRKTRTLFTATADDVQKKKQETRKLQIDIHLLTMKIDAATGDNTQFRLGVPEMSRSESNFYSHIPVGQQVCPPNPPDTRQRVPPPRPPPPGLPVAEQEPEHWKCSACTFANHPALDKCEICEMPRMTTGSSYA